MTVNNLIQEANLEVIHLANGDTEITTPYCCDLLSVAMGGAPEGSAWCTVMANMNTLAVASLADCACIILCCDTKADDNMKLKAVTQDICLLRSPKPIFDMALEIHQLLHA